MKKTLQEWRSDTVGIAARIHMNNAGAALMPRPVVEAIRAHLSLEEEIGGYEAADERADAIAAGYRDLAKLVGAAPHNIAVVANATTAFVQALSCFDFAPADVIVTSRCDYTSNQIQYLALRDRLGIIVKHAADLPEGGVDAGSVRDLVADARREGARVVVAISWIPTNSGLVQDVAAVGRVCEDLDVPFIVDACQAVGQMPVDVADLRCDYLTGTARKFLRGPRGIGFLYASDGALARGDHPLYVDMRGASWVTADSYRVAESAKRYEDWEFPYALVLGQAEAARYAQRVGVDVARARAWSLADSLRQGMAELPGIRILDRGRTRCAIVTATIEGIHAGELVAALSRERINTVVSLREFGQLDFGEKGVSSAIRLSPHYYNSEEEISDTIAAAAEFLRRRTA